MLNDTSEMINAQIAALQGQNFQEDENEESNEYNFPYVIFQVYENKFAVNCKYVVSIEQVAETTEIVNSSGEFRGIAYYKNEPISIFDLRKLFGYVSQIDYLDLTVNIPRRAADHEEYAQTLKNCIDSGTPFTLNTDPKKCAFGKWFYEHRGQAILEVRSQMDRLEPLHDKFHNMAEEVRDLIAHGKKENAYEYTDKIDAVKNSVLEKLDELNVLLHKNIMELNIVLQLKDKKIGLIADSTESVEDIDEIQELPPSVAMTKYIKRIGLSKKDKNIIFILEPKEFSNNI